MTAPHLHTKHCPENVCLLGMACGLHFKTRFIEQFANTSAQSFALAETLQQKVSAWERFNECSLQSAVPSAKYVATAVDRNLSPLLSKQWVRQRNIGTVTVRSWTLIAITKKSQTIHFRHCGCCVGAPTGQRALSLFTPSCAPAAAAAAPPSQSCCWDGAVLELAGQGFQSHNPNRTGAWHH